MERSPIHDYSEIALNNTDTIPDFESKSNKLKITGTIFKSDGVTPTESVILYIYQANESGDIETRTYSNYNKTYIYRRAWVKTNTDGQYTFYTFVPGAEVVPLTYTRTRGLKQIYPTNKEPGKPEFDYDIFIFDDDPFLTDWCRKKLDRKGYEVILKLEKVAGMYVAKRDIILKETGLVYK